MTSTAALMLAFTPLYGDATPMALGLGHEQLIHTESACGSFCLTSANANFDVTLNAIASKARIPQAKPQVASDISLSPINSTSFDFSWHPFYDGVIGVGYRSSQRSAERKISGKILKSLNATSLDVPLSAALRPTENFSFAARAVIRKIEIKQENPANVASKNESYSATPHRWSADALWQKTDNTGFGISYLSPTAETMSLSAAKAAINTPVNAPKWSDPQEFTFSMAHFSSFRPPAGITFGPFENTFHATLSAVTWESGRPFSYAALASSAASKDGWNLTAPAGQTQEFAFDTLDPSLSASAGLESTWLRTGFASVSTLTHVRMNHIAAKRDSTEWQGGFGLTLSGRYISLQASTLWRDDDAGYAFGISSSL